MNTYQAKQLTQGQTVYHTLLTNKDNTPMKAIVTSIKTWKTRPTEVLVSVKHGLYDYAKFDETELNLITPSLSIAKRRYFVSTEADSVLILDKKTPNKQATRYNINEFVSGQMHHNPKTDTYPNYVHKAVWANRT